jgi:HlyD family secretion protein
MTRRVQVALGAVAAAAVGVWAFGRGSVSDNVWAKVERGDLVLGVEVTGTLAAVGSDAIGPPPVGDVWDFKISMMAPEGKDVKLGEPVLGFDTSELERKLLEKTAESESAAKRIEKTEKAAEIARRNDEMRLAEADSKRSKIQLQLDVPAELVKDRDLTQSKLDLQDAEREIAYLKARLEAKRRADEVTLAALRARRDGADRRVREIQASIEAMMVKATRAGTVVYATSWRDEKKKVGDSAWRGERLLEIPDLTKMQARGEVDEADAGKIAVGQTVRFRLEAHPDVEILGKVRSIWSTVQRLSWRNPTKVMKIDVELDKTDPRTMRPGMRFRGTVEIGRKRDAVLVPVNAVFPTPEGPVVYRETTMGHERQRVTIEGRNETSVAIASGVAVGDRVSRRRLDAEADAAE